MRSANVFFKGQKAGLLTQNDDGSFVFMYDQQWVNDNSNPPISITLPKKNEPYFSDDLFPFFFNMLPEGANKQVACSLNRIDSDDYFGLLMVTAVFDTIGAVTIQKVDN